MKTDHSKTVVLLRCNNASEANIIKSLLEANGVNSFITNESGPYPGLFNTKMGAVELHVLEKDIEKAKEILENK